MNAPANEPPPRRRRPVWLTILAVVVLVVAVFLIYASTRPDTFVVTRSTAVGAPPGTIYPMIADFRRWTEWSPYEQLDADLKRTYGGAAQGVGATYAWEGDNAGVGRMEITGETPPSALTIKLDFVKPFEASNVAEFTIRPEGPATVVTWSMTGRQPFLAKVMGALFDMDRMIGRDFETGLANIKMNAEREAGAKGD